MLRWMQTKRYLSPTGHLGSGKSVTPLLLVAMPLLLVASCSPAFYSVAPQLLATAGRAFGADVGDLGCSGRGICSTDLQQTAKLVRR